MSLAAVATPRADRRTSEAPAAARQTRKRQSPIARRLRRHERLLDALDSAVARHGIKLTDEGRSSWLSDQHPSIRAASDAVHRSSRRFIRALLAVYPAAPIPDWHDWYHATHPIIRHREGDRLVLVVAGWNNDADCGDGEPLVEVDIEVFGRVVVVELDA